MEPGASPDAGNWSGRHQPAPSTLPSISRSCGATIPLPIPTRRSETPAAANHGTRAYRSAHRRCASIFSRSPIPADVRKSASSVSPLTIRRRVDIPFLFQSLSDLALGELLLLSPIVGYAGRLAVLGHEISWLHVIRFPVEIENLVLRTQEILRMPVALQTPRHAVRFGMIYHWHVVDIAMATGAADTSVNVGGVIVEHVIGRSMD